MALEEKLDRGSHILNSALDDGGATYGGSVIWLAEVPILGDEKYILPNNLVASPKYFVNSRNGKK